MKSSEPFIHPDNEHWENLREATLDEAGQAVAEINSWTLVGHADAEPMAVDPTVSAWLNGSMGLVL